VSTLQDTFETAEIQGILNQVWETATQGNSGSIRVDPQWPACLACAVVDRARHRSGVARTGVCSSCFDRYCWPGDRTGQYGMRMGAR
jgi:lysophospholipase